MRTLKLVILTVLIVLIIVVPLSVLVCWLSDIFVSSSETFPRVNIKNGTLEGIFAKSRGGRDFVAFIGIPYAQPPLNELRFEPPKPFESWTGVRLAKKDVNICRQFSRHRDAILGDEDCLYLNVYTPKVSSSEKKYPVMLFIHGGGWFAGDGHSSTYGPKFLLDHDIILVTFNYRLGPLGFLSTEDMVSPGNQGLKDQAQAIRWVHENIAAFNGDPKRVTLWGHSAGAVSVHSHMVSRLSRGLFQRAISLSGSVLSNIAISRPGIPKKNAFKIGKLLDCPTNNSSSLIHCLKNKSAEEIIDTDRDFYIADFCLKYTFRPAIEPNHPGAFFKEEPEQSLKSKAVADIPWMTGLTPQEGSVEVADLYGNTDQNYTKLFDEKFMELAPICLQYIDICTEKSRPNVTKSIRQFYLANDKIDESTRMNIVDMYTDIAFYTGLQNSIRYHFENYKSPVYYYYFTYRGSSTFTVLNGDVKRNYGVSHGDELQYIFPMGEKYFPDTKLTEEDLNMVNVMTRLFVNFVETGNPTPKETWENPAEWMPVSSSRIEYFHIGNSKNLYMANNLHPERVKFWASIPYRDNVILDTMRD